MKSVETKPFVDHLQSHADKILADATSPSITLLQKTLGVGYPRAFKLFHSSEIVKSKELRGVRISKEHHDALTGMAAKIAQGSLERCSVDDALRVVLDVYFMPPKKKTKNT